MERTVESRRRRLHLELGAALLGWNHERLAEEGLSSPLPLEQALGIRTTVNGAHHPISSLGGCSASAATPYAASVAERPRSEQQEQPMRITVTTHLERDLAFGHAVQDQVTATADVDLANEAEPVRWISVERDSGPAYTADEIADLTSPLSALEDAVMTEALLRRSALAKATASESAERSVA